MQIEFLSTLSVIAADPPATRGFYDGALGLELEGGEGAYRYAGRSGRSNRLYGPRLKLAPLPAAAALVPAGAGVLAPLPTVSEEVANPHDHSVANQSAVLNPTVG